MRWGHAQTGGVRMRPQDYRPLRRVRQRDDWQVLAALVEVKDELQVDAWLASDLYLRRGARRVTGPVRPGFESRPSAGGGNSPVAFIGRPTAQSCVRAAGVVPGGDCIGFRTHLPEVQRNEDTSESLVLQRADESLDDGDAAVLADGAETRLDLASLAPTLEPSAPELLALVADDVLGLGGVTNGLGEGKTSAVCSERDG